MPRQEGNGDLQHKFFMNEGGVLMKGPADLLGAPDIVSKTFSSAPGDNYFLGEINQLGGSPSRNFSFLRSLPALKIGTQNEEFPPNLDDANLFFFNDSAEMPYGEAGQTSGVGNVEKHLLCGT